MADERAKALVKQVKDASDIVEVVGSYLALRPAGKTFKGLCPFHDDSRPSFDVDPQRQRYRCWSCNKSGDVIKFIEEFERVTFREALELLARRAGINLDPRGASPESQRRALLLDVVRWADGQFQECLFYDPVAEAARSYVGERRLAAETLRRFGIGFAPAAGDWLVRRATAAGISLELLEKAGLVRPRLQGRGHYDFFRDRLIFPIRDARGETVAFGGRILPTSPYKDRAGKYINSAETELFHKGKLLYGLDQARQAAAKAGSFAIVEGYTDVMMAHQMGVGQVVAPMGTALTAEHVKQMRTLLRDTVPRVVLVFDADAGGNTGVDRALEIFASQEVDLAVATLPEGLDPCDLLVQQGADAFRRALAGAVDALDFKLNQVLARPENQGVEGRRRAIDAVLAIIALAPELPGQAGAVKRELMVTRIAHRLAVKEETVWARLEELRARQRRRAAEKPTAETEAQEARAAPHERELLEVLLADPALVAVAVGRVKPEEVQHPGLRQALEGLWRLHAAGEPPDLDQLRLDLSPRLAEALLRLQEVGRMNPNRPAWLDRILLAFRERQVLSEKRELQNQLHAASDHEQALALLRQLQSQSAT